MVFNCYELWPLTLIGPSDMKLFSVLTNQTYQVPWLEQRRKSNKVTEKIILNKREKQTVTEKIILYSMNVKIEKITNSILFNLNTLI